MAGLPDAPEPLGFGNCKRCAYRDSGDAVTCFTCAKKTLDPITGETCWICDGRLNADGRCGNPLCNDTPAQRGWEHIWAIARRTGALERAINDYKFNGKYGWGWIFARVLVGYLEAEAFEDTADLIIPSPTYVGDGGRSWDHIGYIIERAKIEGSSWPFRMDVMAKTATTKKLSECSGLSERFYVVEHQLRPALEVLEPNAVDGNRVIVFDDIFTGGLTLREIAFKLKAAGAVAVYGLVLARQPFRGR